MKRGEVIPDNIENQLGVRYADIQMEQRYLRMKKENVDFQLCTKIRIDTPDLSVRSHELSFDARSFNASSTNCVGSYLSLHSLQNMTSGGLGKTSTSHENEYLPLTQPDVISRGFLSPDDKLFTRSNNLGLAGKRNSSFSAGEDLTPLLPELKYFTGLTPAKSYPNPDYILNLADHESFISLDEQ